jgi:hypothetical protein
MERVQEILLGRFNARLRKWPVPETAGGRLRAAATLSGRTPTGGSSPFAGASEAQSPRQPESETTDAILPRAEEYVGAKGDRARDPI